jgi:predicted DNA binding CopG/RHH family protein
MTYSKDISSQNYFRMTTTNPKNEITNLNIKAPKEIEKLTQANILKQQRISPLLNPRNLKLVANQSQSKPAIVRRNSPSQKG